MSRCGMLGVVVVLAVWLRVIGVAEGAALKFSAPGYGHRSADAVAVADFNNDGKPDIAEINAERPSKIWLQLGRGDGNFGPPTGYRSGLPKNGVTNKMLAADLNHDGHADLLVDGGFNAFNLAVLLNDGAGHLRLAHMYRKGGDFLAEDVNDDALPDLLDLPNVEGDPDEMAVRLGTGGGAFGPWRHYRGLPVAAAATADFNGDGALDVAFTQPALGLSIRFGVGNGGFGPTYAIANGDWINLAVADVNKDGRADILTGAGDRRHGRRRRRQVAVRLGKVDGFFRPPITYVMNREPEQIIVADFDGDGRPDLLTDTLDLGSMALRRGRPEGTFGPLRAVHAPFNYGAVVADVNLDGSPDLVGLSYNAPGYEIRLNTSHLPQNPCVVPPVIGKPLTVAEQSLKHAACRTGRITTRHPGGKSRRRVVAEHPPWGTVRPAGAAVDLVVKR